MLSLIYLWIPLVRLCVIVLRSILGLPLQGEAEWEVFDKLKTLITMAPILILPSDDAEFQVEADSSDFATGATLSQLSPEDGKRHPVTFLSKSLNLVERNYKIHDKEMLMIIRALNQW